jgi:hypothetical protein
MLRLLQDIVLDARRDHIHAAIPVTSQKKKN